MKAYPSRKAPRPLDEQKLEELAVRYVGRFSTTRAKLATYLNRKLRERGWEGSREPDTLALSERFADLGYVNDEAYALAKARSLTGRGYGKRRVMTALHAAGVGEEDGKAAHDLASEEAVTAALRLAERRRIGPFSNEDSGDSRRREKAIGVLVRAGHPFTLARVIVDWPRGTPVDVGEIADSAQLTAA